MKYRTKCKQVGQVSQTNRAAASVSFGENKNAKSVHVTSLHPTAEKHFELLNRLVLFL